MFSPRIRKYLRIQQILTAFTTLLFGILISVISNWLSEGWKALLPWLAGAFVLTLVAAIIITLRQPAGINVLIRAPRTLRAPNEMEAYARRGFVGFVPLITFKKGSASETLSLQERADAINNLEFDRLVPDAFNLEPTIKAILSHASRLEHCWLLSTTGKNYPGSLPVAKLLAEYLKQSKGLKCKFHFGADESITLDDDALVLSKTYDLVHKVFAKAEKLGIPAKDMVANITTGFRSMTLGMVLACLDRDRDIEFIGTHYSETGQPSQELVPITFSFEPLME